MNAIVAIGRGQDPIRLGALPANVRLEGYVPQAALLAHCQLFITHGGFNSVKEALNEGVPMVVIPISADQPYSAERCAALGVAETIDPDGRSPTAIRAAVRKVLTETHMDATSNVREDFSKLTRRRFTSEQTDAATVVVRRRWSVRSLCLPDGTRLIVRPINNQDCPVR